MTVLVFLLLGLLACCGRCSVLAWVGMAGATGAALSAFQRVQSRDVKGDALTNCEKACDGQPWSMSWAVWFDKIWTRACAHGSFALAPVIGAVSAMVFAHLLAAGFISSPILPQMPGPSTNPPARIDLTAGSNALVLSNLLSDIVSKALTNAASNTDKAALGGGVTNPDPALVLKLLNLMDPTNAPHAETKRFCVTPICSCWQFQTCKNLALLLVWGFVAGFSERLVPDMISRLTDRAKASGK